MTDLRREAALDPWAALTLKMYADAWATGYAQSMRDSDLPVDVTHSELVHVALLRLEDESARHEREALIALAKVGPLLYNELKNTDEGGTT